MAVPRAVACPRGWFPPATFQLRLRSLRTILYIGKLLFKAALLNRYFATVLTKLTF